MTTVLFACVHNAGRSQMAAAFFNHWADPLKAHALSAGTHPSTQVHPEVVAALLEKGIDLSRSHPQKLTDDLARQAHLLITMGCGDQCPVIPGLARDDWPFEDPQGQSPQRVREIRDAIERRVKSLVASKNWTRQSQ